MEEPVWGPKRRKRRKHTRKQIREARKWKRELQQKGVTYTKLPKRRRARYIEAIPGMRVPIRRRKRKKSPFDLF